MMVCPDSSSVRTRNEGVLFCQSIERDAHLLLVGLGLGFDGLRDDGLWKHHALEDDFSIRVAEGLSSGDLFETNGRGNVARKDL